MRWNEGGIDGEQAELAAHGAGVQERRFAEAKDRNIHRRPRLVEADVLKMVHEEGVIILALGLDGAADHLAREAVFGQRMHRRDRGRHGLEFELEVGIAAGLHVRDERRQVIVVGKLIGGTLRPDAKGLRCSQFALPTL